MDNGNINANGVDAPLPLLSLFLPLDIEGRADRKSKCTFTAGPATQTAGAAHDLVVCLALRY